MRRRLSFIVLAALLALNMGGTCRVETTQDAISAFLTQIAQTTGQAIGEAIIDRTAP
jgi:hypothetical protein